MAMDYNGVGWDSTHYESTDHGSPNCSTQPGKKKAGHGNNVSYKRKESAQKNDTAEGENVDEELNKCCDSEYEFSEEEDITNILSERPTEWEKITKHFHGAIITREGDEDDNEDNIVYSDEFQGDSSSSEEGVDSKKAVMKCVRFDPEAHKEDPHFSLGMLFSPRDLFKKACKQHGVTHGRKIRFEKNDKRRVKAVCKGIECKWMISTAFSKKDNGLKIMSMNLEHTCNRTFNHGCANSTFLATKYKDDIMLVPHMRVGDIVKKVKLDLNINISRQEAYLTKKKAVREIEGDYESQYSKLHDYCRELNRSNPGSNIFIRVAENENGEEIFQRMYICFAACKKGFKAACRPLVGLDGCHLRGPHKGIFLAAIGLDPNDQIFPIAFAVVEIENKETWKWFLMALQEDLQIYDPEAWTFMTDKQKGLTIAIAELFNGVEHRMCAWHMIKNFKKVHSGLDLQDKMWAAARASYFNKFVSEMKMLKEMDESAYKWVQENTNPKHWSRSHFRTTSKCDILVNNICESFNAAIRDAREKPILGMLEDIRFYLMVRFDQRRASLARFKGDVCPNVQRKLEKIKKISNECIASRAGELVFEIRCMHGDQYTVDLKKRSCSCRKWDLNGLPCSHGIAAISTTGEEVENFVHEYYLKETFERAYEHVIYPTNGEHLWEKMNRAPLLPPEQIKLPGRPKKLRRKDPVEEQLRSSNNIATQRVSRARMMNYKCGTCNAFGHNSRKCPRKAAQDSSNQGVQSQNTSVIANPDFQTQDPTTSSTIEIENHDPYINSYQVDDEGYGEAEDTVQYVDNNALIHPVVSSQETSAALSNETLVKKSRATRCGLCRQLGHNRRNCGSTIAALFREQSNPWAKWEARDKNQ